MRTFANPRPGHCASCEAAIPGRPFLRMGDAYCCVGCADGGPCVCDYEVDLADDGVDHLGLMAPIEEPAWNERPERRERDEPVAVPAVRR